MLFDGGHAQAQWLETREFCTGCLSWAETTMSVNSSLELCCCGLYCKSDAGIQPLPLHVSKHPFAGDFLVHQVESYLQESS